MVSLAQTLTMSELFQYVLCVVFAALGKRTALALAVLSCGDYLDRLTGTRAPMTRWLDFPHVGCACFHRPRIEAVVVQPGLLAATPAARAHLRAFVGRHVLPVGKVVACPALSETVPAAAASKFLIAFSFADKHPFRRAGMDTQEAG